MGDVTDLTERLRQRREGVEEAEIELEWLVDLGLLRVVEAEADDEVGYVLTSQGAVAGLRLMTALLPLVQQHMLPWHVPDDVGAAWVWSEKYLTNVEAAATTT